MNAKLKELVEIAGGGLAIAAVVAGAGLFLAGSDKKGKAETEKVEATISHEEKEPKEGEKGKAEGEEHGKKAEPKKKPAKEASAENGESEEAKKGEKKEEGHSKEGVEGKEEKGEAKSEKSEKEKDPKKVPKVLKREAAAQINDLLVDGEKDMALGNIEHARITFNLAAKTDGGPDELKALALLRLADATFQTDALPAQRRQDRALELYTRLLADYPDAMESETAQYQTGNCLLALGRAPEAAQALEKFLDQYKTSSRAPEARLRLAEAHLGAGATEQAILILEDVLAAHPPAGLRGQALAKLAQADRLAAGKGRMDDPPDGELKAESVPVPDKGVAHRNAHRKPLPVALDDEHAEPASPAKVVSQTNTGKIENESESNEVTLPAPANSTKLASASKTGGKTESKLAQDEELYFEAARPPGMPEAQWTAIHHCLEQGNLVEARRLMRPWLDGSETNGPAAKSSGPALAWARLLRALAARKSVEASTGTAGTSASGGKNSKNPNDEEGRR